MRLCPHVRFRAVNNSNCLDDGLVLLKAQLRESSSSHIEKIINNSSVLCNAQLTTFHKMSIAAISSMLHQEGDL